MRLEKYLIKDATSVVMVMNSYKNAVEVAELLQGDTKILHVVGNKKQHIKIQALVFQYWDTKICISFEDIDIDNFNKIIKALRLYGYKFENKHDSIIVYDM